MAEINLVKVIITNEMIKTGHEMTSRLEESGLEVVASLWLYDDEAHRYYLNIASDFYDQQGPLEFYRIIQEEILDITDKSIDLSDIRVIGNGSHLTVALLSHLGSGHDIPIRSCQYDGIYIDDAYVIKLGLPAK